MDSAFNLYAAIEKLLTDNKIDLDNIDCDSISVSGQAIWFSDKKNQEFVIMLDTLTQTEEIEDLYY